jgi:hypothetical protein
MKRTRLAPILAAPLAFGAVALLPQLAHAGPNGFDEGGYVHLAPGVLGVELAGCCDVGYEFGLGGGYLWTPGRNFKIAFGGAFEHYIDRPDIDGMRFRFLPELRLGAGNKRVWGYGLIGGSFVLRVRDRRRDDDVDPGLGPQFGGGAQVTIYKGLYLGGELDFDVDIYPDANDDLDVIMWFKVLIGYNF